MYSSNSSRSSCGNASVGATFRQKYWWCTAVVVWVQGAMPGNHGRRSKPGAQARPADVPEEARTVILLVADAAAADVLSSCPVSVTQLEQATSDAVQQQRLQVQLESWSQLGELVAWFVRAVLPVDKTAALNFPPCLPKQCRADVHTIVSKKHNKVSESVSEGFGEERHVAVVAKGASNARRMTSEQADHALALWHLYKKQKQCRQQEKQLLQQQQGKQQHAQQQQLQQQEQQQPGQKGEQQHHADQQQQGQIGTDKLAATTLSIDALQLEAAGDSTKGQGAAASASKVYSRDEVAQMLVQDKLPDDLAALWGGPAGEAQRQARLACLAASAGDVQKVQDIVAAQPGLVASGVLDLSSGGQLPLHLAAAAGSIEVLQLLLAAGADVAATNGPGETALQVAQRCEQCDCEALLLQAGAKTTQQDSWQDFSGEL